MRDPALTDLFSRRNAVTAVAEACGISTAAVSQWRLVPWKRRQQVAKALGVDVAALPTSQPPSTGHAAA